VATAHAVTVVTECDPGLHVRGDRRRLQQILINLVANGAKYNRPGGRVTVACTRVDATTVRVTVADNGIGIAAEKFDRLFVPFDRLGADQSEIDGTGIGLALSERLVALLGGRLSVESVVGVGSTFSFDLVAAEDPLQALPIPGDPDSLRGLTPSPDGFDTDDGRRGTVLYVEDNPSNLQLAERFLERIPGIRLVTATTAAGPLRSRSECRSTSCSSTSTFRTPGARISFAICGCCLRRPPHPLSP
jgi:hypothetical protein